MLRAATRNVITTTAAVIDRAATLAALAGTASQRRHSRAESLSHRERLDALAAIQREYPVDPGRPWFRDPIVALPAERPVSREGSVEVVDLAWSSRHAVGERSIGERYLRHARNQVAGARLFRGPKPRPVALCIHGYLGGQYVAEERVFPVRWLVKIGFDVALFTLPFHGVRAEPGRRGAPPFPGSDPRVTNEGFLQAMGDLGDFVAWLRSRGHPSVGVLGMSLGGYSTSLAATVIDDLAFAVPIIPLASLADFARDSGRLGAPGIERETQYAALAAVHQVVSPLHRTPKVPPERVLVIAADGDRITPIAHARRLAKHFGAPLETWPGGHLLQIGRSEAFRSMGRFLRPLALA